MNNITVDKVMLKQWLKSGYISNGCYNPMENGAPQGSLCKASHNEPYAKKVIMQSSLSSSASYNNFIAIYFA